MKIVGGIFSVCSNSNILWTMQPFHCVQKLPKKSHLRGFEIFIKTPIWNLLGHLEEENAGMDRNYCLRSWDSDVILQVSNKRSVFHITVSWFRKSRPLNPWRKNLLNFSIHWLDATLCSQHSLIYNFVSLYYIFHKLLVLTVRQCLDKSRHWVAFFCIF